MTANASFLVADHRNALLLPNAALSWKPAGYKAPRRAGKVDPGLLTVFRLTAAGTAEAVRVKTGAADQDTSEVTFGLLKAGDKVITGDAVKKAAGGGFGPPGGSAPTNSSKKKEA